MSFLEHIFKLKVFILASIFLLLFSVACGYGLAKFSDGRLVRVVSLLQLVMGKLNNLGGLSKVAALLLYYFFLLLFTYILSLVLGFGGFALVLSRGFLMGVVLFMTREAPLSFFLVLPLGITETLLIITAGAAGLQLGREAVRALLGKGAEGLVLSAQLMLLLLPLLTASYFLDNFITSLIFSL